MRGVVPPVVVAKGFANLEAVDAAGEGVEAQNLGWSNVSASSESGLEGLAYDVHVPLVDGVETDLSDVIHLLTVV